MNAIQKGNGMLLNKKKVFVDRFMSRKEKEEELKKEFEQLKLERLNRGQCVNLYAKDLDNTNNDERLRKEFTPYNTSSSSPDLEPKIRQTSRTRLVR